MKWKKAEYLRDWEEFFVKETMAHYLTSRGHFRE
jgi:hypothetical protein